jgi:hypothetical protein
MNNSNIEPTRSTKESTGTAIRKPSVRKPMAVTRPPVTTPARKRVPAPETPLLSRVIAQLQQFAKKLFGPRRTRKLELHEMQQLGEKRFVAIVRVGRQKFLIGGAASSVSLLAEIDADKTTAISPRPLAEETA